MGHTHGWYPDESHPRWDDGYDHLVADLPRLLTAAQRDGGHHRGAIMHSGHWTSVTADDIAFDGTPGCETFHLPRHHPNPFHPPSFILDGVELPEPGRPYAFCKTGRLPYDLAVTATLALAAHHLGNAIWVTSDGTWRDDWAAAAALIERTLNITVANPLRRWPLGAPEPEEAGTG